MVEGAEELELFRRRWRAELARSRRTLGGGEGSRKRKRPREAEAGPSEPVAGWGGFGGILQREPEAEPEPQRCPRTPTMRGLHPGHDPPLEAPGGEQEDLLGQLIRDLNEINEVPFFDIQLPYELALKIFQFLGKAELGRCAQVSRTWKVLAEDQVLWFRLCRQEGYMPDHRISDYPSWKATLRECREKEQILRTNWKNRIGAVSQLQYELGKVLCDVHSCDGVVVAGYTSGDVKLWDTRTWDYTAPVLEAEHGSAEPGPRPQASFVRINSSLAVAAYEDGMINVWSLMFGREPVHRYQHNQKIQAMALSVEGATVATASAFQIKVESANDKGYWETAAEFEIQQLVNSLCLVPCVTGRPVAVAMAEEVVYLLKAGESDKVLHSVYGQPVTCLDVSANEAAFGVKGFGWLLNETNKLYHAANSCSSRDLKDCNPEIPFGKYYCRARSDRGRKVLLYSLETGQCMAQLGSSLGDFTCINLRDSPPCMLVAGNKDRRVRAYDLRTSEPVCSLYGHQLGVSAVQMDDWKIVSGGEEGLVCVWDQRMGTKLWEMHARHPVRHVWFNTHSLITANVPNEKMPRGASIMDDDLTAHRRHRGIIYAYEFSVDQLAVESVLPICRSSYSETTGYNYNIGLAVPYDDI